MERKVWKLRLVRLLYEFDFERQDIPELFRFIDWLLVLPKELEPEYIRELSHIEEEGNMRYVTSIERSGIEKGIDIGALQEARESVLEVLEIRFGVIPEDLVLPVRSVELKETLRSLRRQSILCKDIDTFREMPDRARSKGD